MARCMYPYYVEKSIFFEQGDRHVPVPCGKCPDCLKRRVAFWSHRLEKEALLHNYHYFLTLTYNNDHVPITENGFLSLKPEDVTRFIKRIRKYTNFKGKYYYCGEYGTRFKRPHYHMILFTDRDLTNSILKHWYYGDVFFGKVESGSVKYTVQYYDKGDWQPSHKRDDRSPEFSRMSCGIGRAFLTEEMVNHFLTQPGVSYLYNTDGHKIAIPRYYKKRLYDQSLTDTLVAVHPSILVHRDEMFIAKEKHHAAVKAAIDALPAPEQETAELTIDRMHAIENYKKTKRKSRK